MAVHTVRLGSARLLGEGLRIGTVRRPPRGVPKSEYAARDFYDVWYPNLAPSAEAVKAALGAATDREWATCPRAVNPNFPGSRRLSLLRRAGEPLDSFPDEAPESR